MKTLSVLASVMVVLFLAAPNKIEAQKRKAAKIIEGTISGYLCGDNCYLTITDKRGKEHTGLCSAPVCRKWNAVAIMPDSYKGKRVKVTIGKGTLLTYDGHVVGTSDAFTSIQFLTASPSIDEVRTVTGYLCGHDSGMHAGTIYLRVGTEIVQIAYLFSLPSAMMSERENITRYIKAEPDSDKIGSEYVVQYKIRNRQNEAISITFTGRLKKIQACSMN